MRAPRNPQPRRPYRPLRTGPPPAGPVRSEPTDRQVFAAGRTPAIEQLLQAGKRSEHKRTVALTEKIAELVHDLRGRLNDERQAAEEKQRRQAAAEAAKAKIAELEEQLKAAREQMRGTAAPSRQVHSDQPCPECGLNFANVGVHRFRKHGVRKAG